MNLLRGRFYLDLTPSSEVLPDNGSESGLGNMDQSIDVSVLPREVRMKRRRNILLIAGIAMLVAPLPLFAHHGRAGYDSAKLATVKGTVTTVAFMNPHVLVQMEVKGSNGSVEKWMVEGTSPNMLVREGWAKNTVKPGDEITATGHPAKDGAKAIRIEKLVLSNGQELTFLGPGS
jgi:hypothetical protein